MTACGDSDRPVVIVGQGYVGLPVAMRAVDVGYHVVGLDLDQTRVESLQRGESYVEDISDEVLGEALETGRYTPSADYRPANGFGVAVITVPTPLRESLPDLSFIRSAAEALSRELTAGATVILESTTYPGTTQELLVPILEQGSGLRAGDDFCVGYSPERIDPGNADWGLENTPKVVSGIDEKSLRAVDDFYGSLVKQTVPVSTPREAELTKLLENTFRHVNIALVNELAVFAHQLGVNIWESIDAASTKPFGYMRFTPGPGVGGHCLPVDPSYLSWHVRRTLGESFRFVELANDVNDHMPDYVVTRLMSMLNRRRIAMNGASILLIGLAYKKNTSDIRESPSLRIVSALKEQGARVSAVDPFIQARLWPAGVNRVDLTDRAISENDAIVVLLRHDTLDYSLLDSALDKVFDTCGGIRGAGEVL